MSKIYKVIVITSLALAIECMFWDMWTTQRLQIAHDKIEELERHREILVEVLGVYQGRK